MRYSFPKGFLWGAATSAHQIEGNNIHSDWWTWELVQQQKKLLKETSGIACNSYHRFKEDFSLAQQLGHNAHRLSIEWARIQPEEGKWDQEAIEHYRLVLQSAKQHGLTVFVTLHHFTNPQWFADKGGFTKRNNVRHFLTYVSRVVKELDPLVDFWITINEPEVYINNGYIRGTFPPQKRNIFLAYIVVKNLILAHQQSYKEIKKISSKPVSMAYRLSDYKAVGFGGEIMKTFISLANKYILHKTWQYCDYVGLNYYTSYGISITGIRPYKTKPIVYTDMGWAIHPEGLEMILKSLKKYNKPIYITENGIADPDDKKRWNFIKNHLLAMHKAILDGADVRGYLYWSLIDNFEWDKGYQPRFGLIEIERENHLKRKIRNSASEYKKYCTKNRVEID